MQTFDKLGPWPPVTIDEGRNVDRFMLLYWHVEAGSLYFIDILLLRIVSILNVPEVNDRDTVPLFLDFFSSECLTCC